LPLSRRGWHPNGRLTFAMSDVALEDAAGTLVRQPEEAPQRKTSRTDRAVLASVFGAGLVLVSWSGVPWMVANLVLLGVPLIYLWMRSTSMRARIRPKFTLLFIVFGVVAFDYLCEKYGAWSGPTVAPFKLPSGVSLEEIEWTALYIPLVLGVNEHFFAGPRGAPARPFAKRLLKAAFFAGLLFVLIPPLHGLLIDDTYLKIGLTLEVPVIALAMIVERGIGRELLLIGVVSAAFNLAFEVVALRQGYWHFPGAYVVTLSAAGFQVPVEELIFLVLLSGPSIVATYAIYKNWKQI
jgi:hypothetical protein